MQLGAAMLHVDWLDGRTLGDWQFGENCFVGGSHNIFILFIYCFFTIYSRYLKRVISKRDGCEYLKQIPSIDGSLELI
jgi:hypothetical protein